jgi:hypothetical protein
MQHRSPATAQIQAMVVLSRPGGLSPGAATGETGAADCEAGAVDQLADGSWAAGG